jgi:hypothetical protein
MAISLTEDEIRLLKQLEAAGEHGRTRRTLNSDAALARLIKEGYVVARTAKVDLCFSIKSPIVVSKRSPMQ